jgi:hypothetical protein
MLRKISIFLIIFMLLSITTVSANTFWKTWGNAGAIQGSSTYITSNILFASNFPNGNTNTTNITIASSNSYTPIIDDVNRDSQNEIITFSGSNVVLYDNNGVYLDTYSLPNNICGQPAEISKYSDSYNQVVLMTTSFGGYTIYVLNFSGNTIALDESKIVLTVKTSTCNVLGGLASSNPSEVFIPYTDNVVLAYDYKTDSTREPSNCAPTDTAQSDTANLKGGMSWGKQADGHSMGCWVAKNSGNTVPKLIVFDMLTDDCYYVTVDTAVNGENWTCAFANLGSPSSPSEYIVENFQTETTSRTTYIFDNSLNKVQTISRADAQSSKAIVGDWNGQDGINELILCTNNIMYVYDYNYNNTWKGLTRINAGDCYGFSAVGEYFDNRTDTSTPNYAEFITAGGMYQYSSFNNNMSKIMDFGLTLTKGMFLPVAVKNRANFTKDLVYVSATQIKLYLSSGNATVCGDGTCGNGENVYNCFSDCYYLNNTIPTNETVGTLPPNAQCSEDSWCASGNCENGFCTGLPSGASCTYNDQCTSRVCLSTNICKATDFVDNTQSFVELVGFRSTASKLFLSFVFVVLGAVLLGATLLSLGTAAAGIGAIIGGFFGMCLSIFVFGWMAVFFIVLTVLLIIMLVFLYSIVIGGGGQ